MSVVFLWKLHNTYQLWKKSHNYSFHMNWPTINEWRIPEHDPPLVTDNVCSIIFLLFPFEILSQKFWNLRHCQTCQNHKKWDYVFKMLFVIQDSWFRIFFCVKKHCCIICLEIVFHLKILLLMSVLNRNKYRLAAEAYWFNPYPYIHAYVLLYVSLKLEPGV